MEDVVRKNLKLWAVTIFLFLMSAFLYLRPAVAFERDGTPRPFGTGGKRATVFPVWWWVFLFSVVSYMSVVYVSDYAI